MLGDSGFITLLLLLLVKLIFLIFLTTTIIIIIIMLLFAGAGAYLIGIVILLSVAMILISFNILDNMYLL